MYNVIQVDQLESCNDGEWESQKFLKIALSMDSGSQKLLVLVNSLLCRYILLAEIFQEATLRKG